MENLKSIFKFLYYILGTGFLALGVTLTLLSELGAGGWDALVENLYKATEISIGKWVIIVALLLLIVAAILKKEFINYKAFIVSIILGKLIDTFYYPLVTIFHPDTFMARLAILAAGLILIGIGCAMMFVTGFPKNHTETFVFSIVDTTSLSYQKVKTGADITALLIAVIIGIKLEDFSNLGLGTVLSSVFMGSIIHRILPVAKSGIDILIRD